MRVNPERDSILKVAPKPVKPSFWSRLVQAVGNAIGNVKFGQ